MFVKIPRYIYIHTINKPYEFELIFIFIKIFPKNVGDVRFYYAIRGFTILLINIHNNIHGIFIF